MSDPVEQFNQAIMMALNKLQTAMSQNSVEKKDTFEATRKIMLDSIKTAIDLVETNMPGGAALLYVDIEALIQQGKSDAALIQSHHRLSNLSFPSEDFTAAAASYLENALFVALIRALRELSPSSRNVGSLLQGLALLVTDILIQKFPYPHHILDIFCYHIHSLLEEHQNTVRH